MQSINVARYACGEDMPVAREPMPDVIVLLPGIMGSVLHKDGKEV